MSTVSACQPGVLAGRQVTIAELGGQPLAAHRPRPSAGQSPLQVQPVIAALVPSVCVWAEHMVVRHSSTHSFVQMVGGFSFGIPMIRVIALRFLKQCFSIFYFF